MDGVGWTGAARPVRRAASGPKTISRDTTAKAAAARAVRSISPPRVTKAFGLLAAAAIPPP
jgi:hypothetical protein